MLIDQVMKYDKQVYSHFGTNRILTDKYFGVIIEYNRFSMFAPITHDGDKKWFKRDDVYDIRYNKYVGCLLLCKALPLNKVLTKLVNISELFRQDYKYAALIKNELKYLNLLDVHQRVVKKMIACLENKPSNCQYLRVNYQLCMHNLLLYSKLIKSEKAKNLKKSKKKS